METVIHLDTHVVAWMFLGDERRLRPVQGLLNRTTVVVSPAVVLELQFLFELGRATEPAERVVADLTARVGLLVSDASFARIAHHAMGQSWTRDPFDRLIVGTALAEDATLLTTDRVIQKHCPLARWSGRRK